jgi:hypothetical protein
LLIRQVENRWLKLLYNSVEAEFSNTWLPSHDHMHHARVWTFAKELLKALHRKGRRFTMEKLEQLMIAIFFHDTGLTRTLHASHGKESRQICRKFLEINPSLYAGPPEPILEAVEKHDDKSYPEEIMQEKTLPDDILTMLAVCDDLDAFGAIGVFRYLEIYTRRGIPLYSLASSVEANLGKRMNFLSKNFGTLTYFMLIHQKRYQYTVDFYRELRQQMGSVSGKRTDKGPVRVVNLLVEKVIRGKETLAEVCLQSADPAHDHFSMGYFTKLEKELKRS